MKILINVCFLAVMLLGVSILEAQQLDSMDTVVSTDPVIDSAAVDTPDTITIANESPDSTITQKNDSIRSLPKVDTALSQSIRNYTGFYISISAGGTYSSSKYVSPDLEWTHYFRGLGTNLDIKIGGAVSENFIVSFNFISGATFKPSVTGALSQGADEHFNSISEKGFGIGLTYYFMPHNLFISGSFLLPDFGFTPSDQYKDFYDSKNSNALVEKKGTGFQLKTGKEFWIGRHWAIGISADYYFLTVKGGDVGYNGGLYRNGTVHKFGIMFNSTYN